MAERGAVSDKVEAAYRRGLDRIALRLDRQFLGDVISHLVDIQAKANAGSFRAHRIPVIRAAREPPCIGGQKGDAGSETGTTRNGRICAV
jgi:hypothetical protein